MRSSASGFTCPHCSGPRWRDNPAPAPPPPPGRPHRVAPVAQGRNRSLKAASSRSAGMVRIAEGSRRRRELRARVATLRPDRQPAQRQPAPVEPWPRIALAPRRHVRMPDHPMRRNGVAGHDVRQQPLRRRHLRLGKRRVARIGQFYPDGGRIHIGDPGPFPRPRMPGPERLIDQLLRLARLRDNPMRRNLSRRITKPRPRRSAVRHAGVVDHDQRRCRPIAARPEVRRGERRYQSYPRAFWNGVGSHLQAKPSPSGSRFFESRLGPPEFRNVSCASAGEA